MLADYTKIINLLLQCSTEKVNEAEEQLKRLAAEDVRVLNCIQHCLQDPTLQKNVKILAASTINSILAENINEYTQQFIYKFLTEILRQPAIQFNAKKQLSRSLMNCLQECDQDYLELWKQLTHKALADPGMYYVGLLLLTAFACSEVQDNIIEDIDIRPFYMGFNILCSKFQSKNINYEEILYTFEAWKIVIEYLIHFCFDHAQILFIKMADCEYFNKVLSIVSSGFSTGQGTHNLFLNSENQQADIINQFKVTALELQYMMLKQLTKYKKGRNTFLLEYTANDIQNYMQTLCFVGHNPQIRFDFQIDDILIYMIQLIKVLLQYFPEMLSKSWRHTLHFMIFPFMAIDDQELLDFEENTNSFIQLSEDICQKQQMGVLKSEIASLLQKITDLSAYIEKSLDPFDLYQIMGPSQSQSIEDEKQLNANLIGKYVINYAIASIKHKLDMQFLNKDQSLQGFQIPKDAPVLSVETSFMILSMYSYCLDFYQKQLQDLRIILSHDKIKILPPLERSRIYCFLAYNYEQIFITSSGQIIQTLYYWVDMAMREDNHSTVAYCALDFVTNSLHKLYYQTTVIRVVQKISNCQSPNFWTLLKRMAILYPTKIEQDVYIELIKQSYNRISIQISKQADKKIKITYVISSILNVLRIISQNRQIMDNMPKLKQALWEVNKLYQTARIYYFEDDVAKILNSFLFFAKKQEIEHSEMKGLLPLFLEDFEKSQYQPSHLYVAFNHYIMKGDFSTTVLPIYQVLKKSLKFFLGKKKESSRKKLPIAHTLLLLQNMLAMHGDQFPQQELEFLFQIVKELYPNSKKGFNERGKLVIYDRTLLARALNLQYLCHMYHRNQQVIKKMISLQSCKIYFSYDVSVLLSCIKLSIFKEKDLKTYLELLKFSICLVNSFIEIDTLQKIQKVNEYQKKMANFSPDQDENMEEADKKQQKKKSDLMLRIKKANDFEAILSYINTPFLKSENKTLNSLKNTKSVEDIRKQFKQLIEQARKLNQPLFQSFVAGLSANNVQKLQRIFETKVENILSGQLGQSQIKRPIYKIKAIKEKNVEENGNEQAELISEKIIHNSRPVWEQDLSEEEKQMLKCQKSHKKRMQKLKI